MCVERGKTKLAQKEKKKQRGYVINQMGQRPKQQSLRCPRGNRGDGHGVLDLPSCGDNYRFGWRTTIPIRLQIKRYKPYNLSTMTPLVINCHNPVDLAEKANPCL